MTKENLQAPSALYISTAEILFFYAVSSQSREYIYAKSAVLLCQEEEEEEEEEEEDLFVFNDL